MPMEDYWILDTGQETEEGAGEQGTEESCLFYEMYV